MEFVQSIPFRDSKLTRYLGVNGNECKLICNVDTNEVREALLLGAQDAFSNGYPVGFPFNEVRLLL